MTRQNKEQQILATIISCKKVINGKDANVEMDVALFESVTGGYGMITDEIIANDNAIKFEQFQKLGDNKFAYLRSVREFVYGIENEDFMKPLNENLEFDPFKDQLEALLLELEKNDDFKLLDTLDKEVLNTKLFAKKPIKVLGFNIMETLKVLTNSPELVNVFSILFNKYTKVLYFVRIGQILSYDVKTNEYNILNNSLLNEENYMRVISTQISANVVEIYNDIKITSPVARNGFTDNLFGDIRRTNELRNYKKEISFLNS